MLVNVWLVVKLDKRQVCAGPKEAGYYNAQKDGSHDTQGESVNLGVNNWE
jgi:hypothetical protein